MYGETNLVNDGMSQLNVKEVRQEEHTIAVRCVVSSSMESVQSRQINSSRLTHEKTEPIIPPNKTMSHF